MILRLAIQACHRVDEVKETRDRALALQAYAQQALNLDAERKAATIRIRAERKAGRLLIDMGRNGQRRKRNDPGPGRGEKGSASRTPFSKQTLADLGVSKNQSSTWQNLANVPDEKFEVAFTPHSASDQGSTRRILASVIAYPSAKNRQKLVAMAGNHSQFNLLRGYR